MTIASRVARPNGQLAGNAKSRRTASNSQCGLSKSESDDNYPHIVAVLDARTRVIECANGIQWIVQKRRKSVRPWRSVYFCRTKAGLMLYAHPITPELLALPDHFERRVDGAWLDWLSYGGAP